MGTNAAKRQGVSVMAITKLAFGKLADMVAIKVNNAMLYGRPHTDDAGMVKLSAKGNVKFNVNGKAQTVLTGTVRKSDWLKVQPLTVTVNGIPMSATPMVFSTGTVGWNINGKVQKELSTGDCITMQASGNVFVPKSKELADDDNVPTVFNAQISGNLTVLGSDKWEHGEV